MTPAKTIDHEHHPRVATLGALHTLNVTEEFALGDVSSFTGTEIWETFIESSINEKRRHG